MSLRHEIETAINRNSAENESSTPDYILAGYLLNCLAAFDLAVKDRDEWHGFKAGFGLVEPNITTVDEATP